ncbi:MAG: ParA family protein [Oscillibacter sp.]|nr:ParA family protein [Oscillibacter sp.]
MKTICVMNLKGGVGKTVTACNMAAILAADHGQRVLLIDADHQGNTSKFFHADQEAATLREILLGEAEPYWPENVQLTGYEGLDIIPADMSLAELDTAPEMQEFKSLWRLRDLLLVIADDNAYDYVIIDMPPAFSFAARAALVAADEVIVPIKLDAFSVDGMAELLRQISSMRKVNPRLTLAGVLITMWRNVDVVNQAEEVLRNSGVPVFKTTIRRTDIVDESTFQREPLNVYSPRSAACVDYRRLVGEYLERGEQSGKAEV